MRNIQDFLEPSHFISSQNSDQWNANQIGKKIATHPAQDLDLAAYDIIIVGCGERRGSRKVQLWSHAADAVRGALYQMYDWHGDIKVADIGNIAEGATHKDTMAALTAVLQELHQLNKITILLGGAQDLTLAQYAPYKKTETLATITTLDMLMDLEETEGLDDQSYLLQMFTEQPNFVQHYSHMAFQSYYVNPSLIQTLDRLRFDCYRLGNVRSNLVDMEPILRSSHIVSIDLNVLRACDAPFNQNASPNGLFADELCQLVKYAGMSEQLSSIGFYNLYEDQDLNELGANTLAQALWYFIDGYRIKLIESNFEQTQDFEEYHVSIDDTIITFKKSKRTTRWWMQLPNGSYIPCAYSDYVIATGNEFPERWFRAQERLI